MSNDHSHSYFKEFKLFAKQRWFHKPLIPTFTHEFQKPARYFLQALQTGSIKINNHKVPPNYIIKPTDLITHLIHVHEPPAPPLEIIYKDAYIIIINKPYGIACHPTTNYYFYTITKALENEYGKLACVNRLDVPTSGVLILSTGKNNLHKEMANFKVSKMYIAKVKGLLKDQIVTFSIKQLKGVYSVVDGDGKECYTEFVNVGYKDGYSLVRCMPITGRSHQIRVHLKSIGHPIVGDMLYNEDCRVVCRENEYVCNGEVTVESGCENMVINPEKESMDFAVMHCEGLNNRVYRNREVYLCLHAYQYTLNGIVYTAPLPEWATLD